MSIAFQNKTELSEFFSVTRFEVVNGKGVKIEGEPEKFLELLQRTLKYFGAYHAISHRDVERQDGLFLQVSFGHHSKIFMYVKGDFVKYEIVKADVESNTKKYL